MILSTAALARRANAAARGSKYEATAPVLSADSPREAVVAWLQWCDPNGCHSDESAIGEDYGPYTEEGAWQALAEMLEGQ